MSSLPCVHTNCKASGVAQTDRPLPEGPVVCGHLMGDGGGASKHGGRKPDLTPGKGTM